MTDELQPITTLSFADLGRPIEVHTDDGSVVAGTLTLMEGVSHIEQMHAYQDVVPRVSVRRVVKLHVGGFTFEDDGGSEWRRKKEA